MDKLGKLTTKQKEAILTHVLNRRGYIVQGFLCEVPIGYVLDKLNISQSIRYKKQPFRVIAETTADDFWEQNKLAEEFGKFGIQASTPEKHPNYALAHFYRLATD